MAIALVQSNSGGQNTAVATATMTLTTPAVAGNLLIGFLGTDAPATAGGPAGWTESTGGRQETWIRSYVWWKVAAGGETGLSKALTASGTYAWAIAEYSGTDPSPYDVSAGQFAQSSGATYTTSPITPTAGDRLLIAEIGGSHGTTTWQDLTTWVNGFTRVAVGTSAIAGVHDIIGFGSQLVTASGATVYSSGATYVPASAESRTAIAIAFKAAASGVAASAPVPFISQYGSFH
jgi:hypothetical protein